MPVETPPNPFAQSRSRGSRGGSSGPVGIPSPGVQPSAPQVSPLGIGGRSPIGEGIQQAGRSIGEALEKREDRRREKALLTEQRTYALIGQRISNFAQAHQRNAESLRGFFSQGGILGEAERLVESQGLSTALTDPQYLASKAKALAAVADYEQQGFASSDRALSSFIKAVRDNDIDAAMSAASLQSGETRSEVEGTAFRRGAPPSPLDLDVASGTLSSVALLNGVLGQFEKAKQGAAEQRRMLASIPANLEAARRTQRNYTLSLFGASTVPGAAAISMAFTRELAETPVTNFKTTPEWLADAADRAGFPFLTSELERIGRGEPLHHRTVVPLVRALSAFTATPLHAAAHDTVLGSVSFTPAEFGTDEPWSVEFKEGDSKLAPPSEEGRAALKKNVYALSVFIEALKQTPEYSQGLVQEAVGREVFRLDGMYETVQNNLGRPLSTEETTAVRHAWLQNSPEITPALEFITSGGGITGLAGVGSPQSNVGTPSPIENESVYGPSEPSIWDRIGDYYDSVESEPSGVERAVQP